MQQCNETQKFNTIDLFRLQLTVNGKLLFMNRLSFCLSERKKAKTNARKKASKKARKKRKKRKNPLRSAMRYCEFVPLMCMCLSRLFCPEKINHSTGYT